jgi:HEAT repeat protein
MKTLRGMNLVVAVFTLVGCAAPPRTEQAGGLKSMPAPAPPPAVPPLRNEPINPSLQSVARDRVKDAFGSSDAQLRANAIEAAQLLGPADAKLLVTEALKDRASIVRFAGTMAAGRLKLRDLHDELLLLAEDPSPRVRIGARYALHRIGDTRLSHDLEKFAQDPNPGVRVDTALVLGLLGDKSALKILQHLLVDSAADVRIQAAESMWRLGDERGLDVLVAGSISNFVDDRMWCLMALAAPKDQRVAQHLYGQLTDDDPKHGYAEVALVAARALGDIGLDDGYGVAQKRITSADPRQRFLAAIAFGAIGRSDAQSSLAPLLSDTDPKVRLGAATALLQIKSASGTGMTATGF